ncbi:MAG: choice-of-anchor Q domain-containing protein [Gaiellaceae bacterium]
MRPSWMRALIVLVAAVATATGLVSTAGAGKPAPAPLPITVKCSANDLVAAVQKANKTPTADTIVLSRGCTYIFTKVSNSAPDWGQSALPAVTAPLTIDGNGATLLRDPKAPAFRFLTVLGWAGDPGFVVKGLTFRGGWSQAEVGAGAIVFGDSQNDFTIDGCTFDGNGSETVGGAIVYPSYPGKSLTIVSSVFTNNRAKQAGGAIASYSRNLTLSGDRLDWNVVTGPIDPSRFDAGGGAVFSNAVPLVVTDSEFGHNAVLSGGGGALVVQGAGESWVTGTTFTGNSASEQGGALELRYGHWTITLSHDAFTENHVTRSPQCEQQGCGDEWRGGGAIWAGGNNGRLTVGDTTFTGNGTTTPYGGAIADNAEYATVARSTFTANHVGSGVGGGIWMGSGHSLAVSDSTFTGNIAGAGGGIGLEGGTSESNFIDVSGSTFDHNTDGPALWTINGQSGYAHITNSTFFDNANPQMSQIMLWGGSFNRVASSTIVSTNGAGAISLSNSGGVFTGADVMNSILVAPLGQVCRGPSSVNDLGGNVFYGGGCPGTMLYADPLLGPLAWNGGPTQTMALLVGSPAIDHAIDGSSPPFDQRGVARPLGAHADSGAYER